MPIDSYLEVGLLLLVSFAAVNDLETRRIPNRLLLVSLACALLLRLFSTHPGSSLLAALGGMGTGLALFLPLYLLRGMAAGDVKMMAVVGAFTGPAEVFEIAVLSWCAGGVMAVLLVLVNRRLGLVMRNLGRMLRGVMMPGMGIAAPAEQTSAGSMPYGLAIAAGTIVFLVRQYG
jgi:prepilin peptidase CpaA